MRVDIDGSALLKFRGEFFSRYPSMIEIRWRHYTTEAVSVRRLLHCVCSTFSLNGSNGFFTIISSENVEKIALLSRLGLKDLTEETGACLPNFTIMGHAL